MRSPEYLKFIRSRPCTVTGSEVDVVAHHVRCLGGGGMGIKPSDYMCIPLTWEQHARLHNMGEWSFYKLHSIDIESEIKMNLLIYMAKTPSVDYKLLMSILF